MNRKFLITGRGGIGKSTVHDRLSALSYNSFDTDKFPGLVGWEDLATGQPTKVDTSGYVDYSKVGWNWRPNILGSILAAKKEIFLCGSASNQLDFHPLFDQVFVLTADEETHRRYLKERDSDYGKDATMANKIVEMQAELVEAALALGAVAIDNSRPVDMVVDQILAIAHET